MAKLCLKKPSKRLTCRKKFKIQKKVKEHNKKLQKLAKEKSKRKSDKPISVPNKCPFKEQMLMEAEQKRTQRDEEKKTKLKAQKLLAKKGKLLPKTKKTTTTTPLGSMETLKRKAAQEQESFNENQFLLEALPEQLDGGGGTNAKAVKTYATEVRRTIDNADIVLEVLDARDPLGSRSHQIEKLVLDSGKRLVLLLNKIDLVPKENLHRWLAHLRKQLPTVAFKASTQEQSSKLGRFSYSNLMNCSLSAKCIGADLVMKLLGNYCRNRDIKTSIRVGVVGFPNVGKSSVINSLKRRKSCQTGATPGLTKQIQEVQLDKHIRLIDSPGVVLAPRGQQLDASELSLKNVVRVETLTDPVTPVQAILRRCSVKVLMLHYRIAEFADCEQFLALLSRRFGRLKKGGRPDINASAKQVLNDWNSGKLRYYTEPPEEEIMEATALDQQLTTAELVAEFSKEFDLDALDQDIRTIVDALPENHMAVDAVYGGPSNGHAANEDEEGGQEQEEEEMDTGDQPAKKKGRIVVVVGGQNKKKKKGQSVQQENNQNESMNTSGGSNCVLMPESLAIGEGNVQLGRAIKQATKKMRKQQRKMVNKAGKLADKLEMGMELE